MLRTIPSHRQLFILGFLAAAIGVSVFTLTRDDDRAAPRAAPTAPNTDGSSSQRLAGVEREVQHGPLANDVKITLEEAKGRSPYKLPVPPTNAETGERTGIWIDPTAQIAFVWGTDMTFYVARTEVSEEQSAQDWAAVVSENPEEEWQLTTVRGHPAIGRNGSGDIAPSSLTWVESGLSLQFVAPGHTLEELKAFAESIQYEQ